MDITIKKSLIETVLANLQPFLEKKDDAQITSHLYFQASDTMLHIKATDYEIGLHALLTQATILQEGQATANGKKLLDIVRRLKENDIRFYVQDGYLVLEQGASRFKLPMFNAEEFPAFPQTQDKPTVALNSIELIRSIKKIIPSIDSNNPKPELNGALLDAKPTAVQLVSTDTRRLSIVTLPSSLEEELSLIVPKKAIIEIQKLFFDDIRILFDEVYLMIQSDHYLFFTKLINGKFPEYQRIIPKESKHALALPKDSVVDAVKLITSVSQEIKLTILNDRIIFEGLSDENSEAKTELECQTTMQAPFSFALNSRYMLDYLSNCETKEFFLLLNEPNMPFVLKSENYMTIVMPIIL